MMRFPRLLICSLLFLQTGLFAQAIKWERVYGGREYEYGRSIVQLPDRGYIIAGTSSSYGAATDVYLLRINENGSFRWHKNFFAGNDDWAYCVKYTPADSGFIVCGFTNSEGNGGYDAYLLKTDSLGNEKWHKTYGGPDWDFAYSVDLCADGGYVLAGGTYSYGAGNEDMYMIKTDANGNEQWFNVYGGMQDDNANDVKQTPDGGYILAGRSKSFNPFDYDMWVVKTTFTGDTAWTHTFGDDTLDDAFNSVCLTSTGGYAVAGYTRMNCDTDSFNVHTKDIFMVLLDNNGTVQIIHNDFPLNSNDNEVNSITENADGQFFTTGVLNTHGFYKQEFNYYVWYSNLSYHWGGSRGGTQDELAWQGQQTTDGGYVVVGSTETWGNGKADIYIVKLDTDLTPITGNPTIGIAEEQGADLSGMELFPNPASDVLCASISEQFADTRSSWTITDVLGREMSAVVFKGTSRNGSTIEFHYDMSALPEGWYAVSLRSTQGTFTRKFLVKH